jgi:hypothetical protein
VLPTIDQTVNFSSAEEQDIWFKQDGATAPTAKSAVEILQEFFGDHIISLQCMHLLSPDFYF